MSLKCICVSIYPSLAPSWLGFAHYMLKEYSEALPPLRECVSRAPNLRNGHVWLAATYAQLGQLEEARAEAVQVLRIEPNLRLKRKRDDFVSSRTPATPSIIATAC